MGTLQILKNGIKFQILRLNISSYRRFVNTFLAPLIMLGDLTYRQPYLTKRKA